MPVAVRRALYGLLAVLGFVMMVPLSVNAPKVQSALEATDPLAMDPDVSAWISGLGLLFLAGLCVAASFIYLVVSTGYPKAWRPVENGQVRCARCGAEVASGLRRCPNCDQQQVW
jgi:uncharacterized BrkB/YihY/UPF0761 family membrane protein